MFSRWSGTRDRLDISDGSVAEDSFTGVGWLRLSLLCVGKRKWLVLLVNRDRAQLLAPLLRIGYRSSRLRTFSGSPHRMSHCMVQVISKFYSSP